MTALDEIQTHLEDQERIIMDVMISYDNMKRLSVKKYDYEERIKKQAFFYYHFHQLKFILIIQLSKLFGSDVKNDKRSFHALLGGLEKKKIDYSELPKNYEVKPPQVIDSDSSLRVLTKRNRKRLKDKSALISDIVTARNKVYAHTDPQPEVKHISLEDLGMMVRLAVDIFNDIKFHLFFSTTHFETKEGSVDFTLKVMSDYEFKRIREIERKRNQQQ